MKWTRRASIEGIGRTTTASTKLRFEKLEARYCMDGGLLHREPLDDTELISQDTSQEVAAEFDGDSIRCGIANEEPDTIVQNIDIGPKQVDLPQANSAEKPEVFCDGTATDHSQLSQTNPDADDVENMFVTNLEPTVNRLGSAVDSGTSDTSNESLDTQPSASQTSPANDESQRRPSHPSLIYGPIASMANTSSSISPLTHSVESLRLPEIAINQPNSVALQDLHAFFATDYLVAESDASESGESLIPTVAEQSPMLEVPASAAMVIHEVAPPRIPAAEIEPIVDNAPLLMPIVATTYIAESAPGILQMASHSMLASANTLTHAPVLGSPPVPCDKSDQEQKELEDPRSIQTANPMVLLAVAGLLGIPELVKRRMRSKHLVLRRNSIAVADKSNLLSVR